VSLERLKNMELNFMLMRKTPCFSQLALLIVVVCSFLAGDILAPTVAQAQMGEKNLLRGQTLFKKCIHCHTYKAGDRHRIGPNLFGMFGRKAGNVADYDFSDAWKNATFVWTDKTLDTYLLAPHKMIPNNRMPFDGLSRREDRQALIKYMRTIVQP
jgi:cytochrome c